MENKSFTLIEILVTIGIFFFIVGIATGVFVSSIRVQKQSLAQQQLLDQTSYVMEYMSRGLRMAKKDLTGACITAKKNYENPSGDSSVRFIKFDHDVDKNICHEFFFESNQLKERRSTDDTAANFQFPPLTLTSPDLTVNSLKFKLRGEAQTDNEQPRVTIFLDIEGKEQSKIKIQTTVSQRNPDTEK